MAVQIITIGGGGFLCGSEPGLEHYILEQSRSDRPRIGFIATASGDASNALVKFYSRFTPLACKPSHLGLFDRTPGLEKWFANQDVIYVGGGNTKSMLAVWRDWGLPGLLRKVAESGTILAGISAGAICWFEHGVTDSMADRLRALPCLGFISGSCCPHYSGEPERRPGFESLIAQEQIPAGIAIDDGAAVHFIDGKAHRIVSGRQGASAYRVSLGQQGVQSENLAESMGVTSVD